MIGRYLRCSLDAACDVLNWWDSNWKIFSSELELQSPTAGRQAGSVRSRANGQVLLGLDGARQEARAAG